MTRFSSLRFAVIGCALVVLSACSRVTSENFAKIKVGMTSDQVKEILGTPSETKTQGALSLSSTTYTYKKGGAAVTVVFLNDKVMAKTGDLK